MVVAVVIIVSSSFFAINVDAATYSSSSNSGKRGEICTSLDGTGAEDYYTGNYTYDNLSTLSQSALLSSLRTLMTSTHKYISSYDDCHYRADQTDCENNNGKVLLLYTSYTATMDQYNGWNREHVWPKSLGGNNTSGGGADLHHIRPSDAVVNSTRGNKKYGYADGGKAVNGSNPATGYLGGHYKTYFEPLDNVKGDVARIVLYVYVRWGTAWGADSVTEVFQSVDVLLEWCELDPVDTWEMGRNEVVENIQGNRNVFIDYPELAWTLFGKEVPDDMTTPSGEASGGTSDIDCKHASTELRGAISAKCGEKGYTGDTYCTDCGEIVIKGSDIAATGEHTFGDWQNDGKGNQTRKCQACDTTESRNISATCTHTATEERNQIDATCSKYGYSGDTYCVDCGKHLSDGARLPMLEHDWSDYTPVTPASDGERSMEKRSCALCGIEELRFVEKNSYGKTIIICTASAAAVALCAVATVIFVKRKKH